MLEQHQAQDDLRRHTPPATRAALGMPCQESRVNGLDELLIFQHLVGLAHPRFPEIGGFFLDESFAEAALCGTAEINHLGLRFLVSAFSLRSNCWFNSQIFSRAAFLR
jgi:hypothetical protein